MVWRGAGYLAGLGIRKAAASAADKARYRQAMSPADAIDPRPLLDINRVITDGNFFQLGVPWGWRDLYPEELAEAAAQAGLPVLAGVAAERADNEWTGMLVSPLDLQGQDLSGIMMQPDEFHQARWSRLPNGHPLGSPTKILINGELGLIFHFGSDVPGSLRGKPSVPVVSLSETECYFARRGQGFRVEFQAGSLCHERYLPCLWTMFGSWRWLR
jgi:hypothetical protein